MISLMGLSGEAANAAAAHAAKAIPKQALSAPRRRNRGGVILCCLQFALDAKCCLRGVAVKAAEASTQDKNSWVRDAQNHAGLRRRSASTSPGSRVRSRSRWLRRLTWAIPSSLLSSPASRNALFFFERHDALAATRSAGGRPARSEAVPTWSPLCVATPCAANPENGAPSHFIAKIIDNIVRDS